jgi:hypothetical protein
MKTKICSKCKEEKPISEFYIRTNGYLYSWCKKCSIIYSTETMSRYKEQHKEYMREYYKTHKEYWKSYYKTEEARERRREYEKTEKYKERRRPQRRIYEKERRKDPAYRLNNNISTAISSALRGRKKGRHWETIVGYTVKELKKHLEKYFTNGMAWENYGEWHIDHIIPISLWTYTNPEDIEFKKCWSLENLRPVWAKDNVRKNGDIFYMFYEKD